MIYRILFSVAACVGLTTGCGWSIEARTPAPYVEVTTVPVEIETSPTVVYEGHPTYLYQDRWYYRDGGRWRYYRNEPGVLVEHRRRLKGGPARHEERREDRHEDRDHRR